MTDEEWARLAFLLDQQPRKPGGRPSDKRKTWNAIFWIACSTNPWRELPDHLGRPDAAQRALRRAARGGVLRWLLLGIADMPGHARLFHSLRWRISRACRRVAKLMPLADVLLADRLGLTDALPCRPHQLPDPSLSESLMRFARLLPYSRALPWLMRFMQRLHRIMEGDFRAWRRTA